MKQEKIENVNQKENATIQQEIKKTLAEITRFSIEELEDSVLIREELGVDSLMAMEIVANLEKKYKIKIDEKKLENVNNIGEFVNFIVSLIE